MGVCKIKGTAAAVTLQRYGINIEPGYFNTPTFIDEFGNWVDKEVVNDTEKLARVNGDGSPALYGNNAKTQLFYINKEGVKRPITQVKFSTLPYATRDKVSQLIVGNIVFELYNTELIDNDGAFRDRIEATKTLSKFYDETVTGLKMAGTSEGIIESMIVSKADYLDAIKARLRSVGIIYAEEDVDYEEPGTGTSAIKQKPSYERKAKDKASANIKLMLETLPAYDFNGDPLFTDNLVNLTSPSVAWGVLLQEFANMPLRVKLSSSNGSLDISKQEGEDILDDYMMKLDNLVASYPWAETIVDYLEGANQATKLSFFAAFNNVKNKIYTATVSGSGVNIMSTEESGSDARFILDSWVSSAKGELFPNNSENLDDNSFDLLYSEVTESVAKIDDFGRISEGQVDYHFAKLADIMSAPMNTLGIPIDAAMLRAEFWKKVDKLHEDPEQANLDVAVVFQDTLEYYKKFLNKSLDITSQSELQKLIKLDLRTTAEAANTLQASMSDHMASVGRNRVYLYSLPTVIQEQINELKANPSIVKEMLKLPKFKNSIVLQEWSNPNTLSRVEVGLRGVVQKKGAKAKDGNNISKSDYLKVDMNSVLRVEAGYHKPLYNTQVPADKNREYMISLQAFRETESVSEAVGLFYGYFIDEYQEMVQAKETVRRAIADAKKNNPDMSEEEVAERASQSLVIGYTLDQGGRITKTENGRTTYTGGAFKFKLFESFNDITDLGLIDTEGLPIASTEEEALALLQSEEVIAKLSPFIGGAISRVIAETQEALQKADGKIDGSGRGDRVVMYPGTIDSKILDHYKNKYIESEDTVAVAREAIFRDYVVNSMMSKIEYSKLFTGSLQYFKRNSDYIKRVPSTYIDGLQMATGLKEGDLRFRQMTFQTESFSSFLFKDDKVPLTAAAKSYYQYIDRTDAQAWITPKRWKDIMIGTGKFGEAQSRVYDKLEKQWAFVNRGESIPTELNLSPAEIKTISLQPLKGVYFKNSYTSGPLYMKYSQAVLIPSFIENLPKAKGLFSFMEKNNIDEMVADTGVKVGSKKGIELKNIEMLSAEEVELHTSTLDNRNWRLQQDLPTKLIHDNKIGTQIQKIIVASLRFRGDVITDSGRTGMQLADDIDDALAELSNIGTKEFLKKYGIEDDFIIKDTEAFYSSVLKDMESDGTVNNAIHEALRSEIPLAALPSIAPKVIASFFAANKRATTNLMTSGGSFIQISDHLIDGITAERKGITMLVDKLELGRLQPPRVEARKDKTTVVVPGQVFVPHSLIAKFIPDYRDLSLEELQAQLPKEVLQLIGYRIPTQSRASTEALQIVGILPPEMGDSIIAYGEITAKTGSDFDIDKMFFMAPELEYSDGQVKFAKPFKIRNTNIREYYYDAGDPIQKSRVVNKEEKVPTIKGKKNEVFSLFMEALKTPALYEDLMTSIDNDTTEASILAFLPSAEEGDLHIFSPITAIETRFMYKAGQAGIGEMVNANNDHIRSQGKVLNYELGLGSWGNSTFDMQYSKELSKEEVTILLDRINAYREKKGKPLLTEEVIRKRAITDVLSELTNAFVDIANKEAFITKANWGSLMNSYGTMLIRAGVHPSKVFMMLMQPAVTDMIRDIGDKQGIIKNKSAASVRDKHIKKYRARIKAKREKGFPTMNDMEYLSNIDFETLVNLSGANKSNSYYEDLVQLTVLQHINDSLEVTKQYANTLTTSKMGETGAGKSIGDMRTKQFKIEHSMAESLDDKIGYKLMNLKDKYFDSKGEHTLLMTYYENTVEILDNIIEANSQLFYGMNKDNARKLSNIYTDNNASKYLSSAEIFNSMQNAASMYLLSGFAPLNTTYSEAEDKALSNRLFALRDTKRYEILEKVYVEEENGRKEYMMNKISALDNDVLNTLSSSWSNLLREEPAVGKYLVHKAYGKAGFAPGPKNFAQLIPPMWLVSQGLQEYIITNTNTDLTGFEDQLFRNEASEEIFTKSMIISGEYEGLLFVDNINNVPVHIAIQDDMSNLPKYARTIETDGQMGETEGGYPIKLLGTMTRTVTNKLGVDINKVEGVYMYANKLPKGITYYDVDEFDFADRISSAVKEDELQDEWQSILSIKYKASVKGVNMLETDYRKGDLPQQDLSAESFYLKEEEKMRREQIGLSNYEGQQSDIC